MADRNEDGKVTGREIAQAVRQMDRMLEIVLMAPGCVFVGLVLGMGLDRWLHQQWMCLEGIGGGFGGGAVQL